MSSAALAWRASIQIAGSLSAVSAWKNHTDSGPVSNHPLCRRRMLADQHCKRLRIRGALAAPDTLAVAPDRYRSLFHRDVEADIFVHGCSPSDVWVRLLVVSPRFHLIGEQPPGIFRMLRRLASAITPCAKTRDDQPPRLLPGAIWSVSGAQTGQKSAFTALILARDGVFAQSGPLNGNALRRQIAAPHRKLRHVARVLVH